MSTSLPPEPVPPGSSTGHTPGLDPGTLQSQPEFQELRRTFRRFVFPATAAFLAWYTLYVAMSAWARDFMGTKIIGVINVAFVFGLLQFASTFLIAYFYSQYAARRFDPIADRLAGRTPSDGRHSKGAGL